MSTVEIVVVPLGSARFQASVGDRVLCVSRTPFCSAARVLLAEGYDPSAVLIMKDPGSTEIRMQSTVGIAAGLTVRERDDGGRPPHFVKWEPFGGLE